MESEYQRCSQQYNENNKIPLESLTQLRNIKEALDNIDVKIKMSEKKFRRKYGFWKIKGFKVYGRDGNYSTCSFKTKIYAYVGYYSTS